MGAGPVGLFLANDLALLGTSVTVVERLEAPTGLSKALGIQGRGVELLEARGLLPRVASRAVESPVALHFSGIPLNAAHLEGRKPRFLFVPQAITESLLAERAAELDVDVRRGRTLRAIETRDDGVIADLGVEKIAARFLVGCDGGRSTVRELAGIAFPGSEPTMLWRIGDVRLANGELPAQATPFGLGVPLGDGWFRITVREQGAPVDRDAPMTLDELRDAIRRVQGIDLAITEARWLSRFTDASRQAASYRAGNVFLAGDAAHTHLPAGGPGISTGLGDASNLAWKLAATLAGWAPADLLDTYHAERHPAGARVLMHTRAQAALMTPTANVAALRELLRELFEQPGVKRAVVDLVQGAEPALGRWLPFPGPILKEARGVLFASEDVLRIGRAWSDRIDLRPFDGEPTLVRPDGLVAEGEVEQALARWFGEPTAPGGGESRRRAPLRGRG